MVIGKDMGGRIPGLTQVLSCSLDRSSTPGNTASAGDW